jgi:hypothetical protein
LDSIQHHDPANNGITYLLEGTLATQGHEKASVRAHGCLRRSKDMQGSQCRLISLWFLQSASLALPSIVDYKIHPTSIGDNDDDDACEEAPWVVGL